MFRVNLGYITLRGQPRLYETLSWKTKQIAVGEVVQLVMPAAQTRGSEVGPQHP